MSSWPYVVLLLTTRCLYWGVHLTVSCLCICISIFWKCQADHPYYCSWPPDASTWVGHLTGSWLLNSILQNIPMLVPSLVTRWYYWGSIRLKCKKDICIFWTHFRFGSCITEVFSMKGQWWKVANIMWQHEYKGNYDMSYNMVRFSNKITSVMIIFQYVHK